MSHWFTFTRAYWIWIWLSSSEPRPLKSCQKVPTVSRAGVAVEVLISTHWELTKAAVAMSVQALARLKNQVLDGGWNKTP